MSKTQDRKISKPFVSVVITTKNEENNIENCLQSISFQDYQKDRIEIIVVDNNSSDKTKEIAQKYTRKIFNHGPERSAQRNFGISKAKGKYVIYLDADMILSPTVIEKAVEKFEPPVSKNPKFIVHGSLFNPRLAALYIPEIILGNSYWSRVRRFERSFYDGTVIDCVRVVRREIIEKVGGFDTTMTGPEDWDFDKKIRKIGKVEVLDKYNPKEINSKLVKINYQKNSLADQLSQLSTRALVYHNEAKLNLKKYFQKKSYYAKSFNVYICRWGRDDQDIKKQFGFWYRYFGVFLENDKWKRFLRYPVLVFGVYLLRFLVGLSFIIN